ncbi:MAG: nucleotidyltransferase family protein [Clostridia bacterium]|nr:nucleotidyltransferase family protein [Clostridia bacterium]
MKALILAAGYATRLYPLTKDMPKSLLPIGNGTMMDFLAARIRSVSQIDKAYIVTNAKFAQMFEEWAKTANEKYAPLEFAVIDDGTNTNDTRLGAVGDIAFSIDKGNIDDDLLIAASDDFFTFDLNDFTNDFFSHGKDLLLATHITSLDDLKRFAVATLDETGRVIDLEEKPENPKTDIAIYALYLYRRDTLPLIRQYLDEGGNSDAPGHFPEWLYKRREVRVHMFKGECVDIGTVESYYDVCERFKGAFDG